MQETSRPRHYNSRKRTEFSERQRHILDLIVQRYTNPQIADDLGITLDGAKWHISEILSKLGVDSREEAAEFWRVHNGGRARLTRAVLLVASTPVKWVAIGAGVSLAGLAAAIGLILAWPGGSEVPATDVPAANVTSAVARVDTGDDLVFVVDRIEYDGTSTAVTYHLEGDLSGVRLLPGQPTDPSLVPGIEVRDRVASGTVSLPGKPEHLRFPPAIRRVEQELRVQIPIQGTSPVEVVTPHGSFSVEWQPAVEGETRVLLTGREALALISPDTSNGVTIVDDLGNVYPFAFGSVATPAAWDDPNPATALATFAGELADGAQTATLILQTYDALISGDWQVPTNLP
jgi:DNA-binding CsgD family transcriptional regulator